MPQQFTSTRRFRLKILACMLKPGWLSRYGPILKPDYFERKDEYTVAEALLSYYKSYNHPPWSADDLTDILEGNYVDLIHSIYLGADEWDLDYVSDMAVQFAREQSAKMAVLGSLGDIERGELASVVDKLQEAMKVGQDIGNLGLDFKDVDTWLSNVQTLKVPTGMIHLDIAMGGGLAAGELGVWLAPPNYGKSMALINTGYGAAGPISRCNVIHFSLEMAAHVVAKRYATRMIFRFPGKFNGNGRAEARYKDDLFHNAKMLMPGDIRIIHAGGTVSTLESHVNVLIDNGFEPDLIIVDYGDIVAPTRHRDSHWIEAGDTYKALRDMAIEFDCPLWTASQARRSAVNKEFITMSDLAESFQKAAIADAIVAICQTREEEEADQCRLFLAKLRDGASRSLIDAKFYKKQQAIITTGFTTRNIAESV